MMSQLAELLTEKRLTPREKDVTLLLIQGKTNLEIGTSLELRERTIKWHITSIYSKFDVKSRAKLMVICLPLIPKEEAIVIAATLTAGESEL